MPRTNKMEWQEPLKAGAVVLSEEPFVFILSAKEHGLRCDHCFAKGKVLKCSGCQYIYYCSKICQREAWAEHKGECAGYRRVLPRIPPDAARLMARIVRKLASGGSLHRGYYTKKKYRVWMDLMSHYQDLKVDHRRMEHFTSLCAILFQFLTDVTLPNSAELMGIYGRMVINSFTILDAEMLSVGTGLYMGTSILDHSCDPNAVATFTGKTIHIRLTKDIPVLDFSKVFISYTDLLNTPFDRQSELQSIYYFLCQCERCLDNHQISLLHAACCPNKQCDYPLQIPWENSGRLLILSQANKDTHHHLEMYSKVDGDVQSTLSHRPTLNGAKPNGGTNSFINKFRDMSINGLDSDDDEYPQDGSPDCPKCGTHVTPQYADKFKSVMEFSKGHLDNMRDKSFTYVDVCRACLDRQEGVLHPLNIFYVKTLDHAMDGCIEYQMWGQAVRYAKQLIPGFKNYYGEFHPLYGLLLLKLGKILVFEGKNQEALTYLHMASQVLKITHGHINPIITQVLQPLYRQADTH